MGWDHLLDAALLATLGLLLLSAGFEDARHREIANGKTLTIALLAPLWWWANGIAPWPDMGLQLLLAAGVLVLFHIAYAFGWMGGGDVKLIAALALWLPPGALVLLLEAMSLAGGALTVAMVVDRRLRRATGQVEVPYGVAIAGAALMMLPQIMPVQT